MADWNLTKVYSDRNYVLTTTVRHQGTTIAFAMDDQRRIRYCVLDLDRTDVKEGSPDVAFWPDNPGHLKFPAEITQVGFAAAGNVRMPVVKRGGRAEPAAPVLPEDVDPFLSTTARLTAAAPFKVVSDGLHVIVFRQSISKADADAVFLLTSGGASGDASGTGYAMSGGAKLPVVDSTLLCDRFVMAGSTLVPLAEVRYRRSRDRARPDSTLDTPGTRDMDGNLFAEPTQNLSFVRNLTGGAFAVLLLPTAVAEVSRWQVFARNGATQRIDSFSVEQGADGLFNTMGTQLYTSADPKYTSSVLERAPGKDPFTGNPLVPVIDTSGMAETALRFDGSTGYVTIASPALKLGASYTLEAWVKPAPAGGTLLSRGITGMALTGAPPAPGLGFGLALDAGGALTLAQAGAQVKSTTTVGQDKYHHVAAVVDGGSATLYVDGAAAGTGPVGARTDDTSAVLVGASSDSGSPGGFLAADVDEVRLWSRAVSAAELAQNRYHRMVGNETGLVAYYRCDEGAGTTLYDETDNGCSGTFTGGCSWVTSTAGVGDGPGLSRESYAIAGRSIVSGLAAALYYQQEQAPAGYDGKAQPIKKQGRVLLSCATAASSPQAGDRSYVAALDFAVGRDGRLAQLPMQVTLPAVDRTPGPTLDTVIALQQQVADLTARIARNNATIAGDAANEDQITRLEWQRNVGVAAAWLLLSPSSSWLYGPLVPAGEIDGRLATCYGQRAAVQAARADNAVADGERRVLQDRLATATAGMQGSEDVGLPMRFLSMDGAGLSVYGGLLTFAWTNDAPFAMDSASGDVTLYFRGGDGQFFAVYYDTRVQRATKKLDAGGTPLRLAARDPGIALSGVTVTVSAGSTADLCKVAVTSGQTTETFNDVPRQTAQFAAVLNGRSATYPYATAASSSQPGASVMGGSQYVSPDARVAAARVSDGTAADDLAGQTCRWHAGSAGRAFAFDGKSQRLALPGPSFDAVRTPGDVTVEAWVNPTPDGPTLRRVVTASSGDSSYTLGLAMTRPKTALSFGGASFLDCGPGIKLDSGDFTVEVWAARLRSVVSWEMMLSHGVQGGGKNTDQCLHFGFTDTGVFRFGLWSDDLDWPNSDGGPEWHHWAGVYIRAQGLQILYRDGVEVARRNTTGAYSGVGNFLIAKGPQAIAMLNLDEVRVWGRARTPDQISQSMNRRLTGHEPGLLGYWSFPGGQTADLSGHRNDGTVTDKPAVVDSAPQLTAYQVVAGSGTTFVRGKDTFPGNQWGHVAAAFKQDWGLRFDGNAYLSVDHEDALNLGSEYTIEVFFQLDSLGGTQELLWKGPGTGPSSGYWFLLDSSGSLGFGHSTPTNSEGVGSSFVLQAGFHRVAVIRRSTGASDPRNSAAIKLYADGQAAANEMLFDASRVVSGTGPLEMGGMSSGKVPGLKGILGEVRIWSIAMNPADLGKPVDSKAKGLVARWHFPENAGNTTKDDGGRHVARLNGAKWVRNPDPLASAIQLYHDGSPADAASDPTGRPATGLGDQQFTLAGRVAGGTLADGFAGTLDEVRVWRTARTQREILDNLFTRLDSRPADLVAYYPFDAASTAGPALVRDAGPRGNDLTAADPQFPKVVLSTAPVSGDIPAVRTALTGLVTAFCEGIDATPAVGEYATIERSKLGGATGEMKRCYSYLWNGNWRLVTGYKVGELVSDWVGQAQFDPQLYGYVEGAPPVPSENLTVASANPDTQDFNNASKVTFTQTDKVTGALHSGGESKAEWAAKVTGEIGFETNIWTIEAPLGFGFAQPSVGVKVAATASLALEGSNGWTSEMDVSQATGVTRSTVVGLNGQWEDAAKVAFPGAGRRYVPANTGFAVVRSQTADVYALRMARTRALVAFRMLPNPDIPRDWNLITFPINPLYVKQGTLDGAIGYDQNQVRALDPSYPMAATPGDYSYYKPREAYALKRRIELERHRLKGFYESVSTATGDQPAGQPDKTTERGRALLAKMSGQQVDVGGSIGGGAAEADTLSRRNLANTYVWTAAGGFFAEATDTTDSVTETSGGSWSLKGTATVGVSGSGDAFGGTLSGGWELSLAGSHSETRTKKTETQEAFTLAVECAPGRALSPGRVDAYRFMTFYLDSAKENFEDFYGKVVDPTWLAQSSEASAIALRQAQQSGKKPPCWRILHRVTFVSRVLPAALPATAPPVETAAASVNLASSYELVRRLDPLVHRAATSRNSLADATRSALTTMFPALVPSAPQIIDFLALYYGVTS